MRLKSLAAGLLLFCSAGSFAETSSPYASLLKERPFLATAGSASQGEIELLLEPEAIEEAKKVRLRQLLKRGVDLKVAKEECRVGYIAADSYWIWIRDAVLFPSGAKGLYNRLIPRNSLGEIAGVAILPMTAKGKVALIRTFRHATRSWEWELPRGGIDKGETVEEAARRELKEETGYVAHALHLTGTLLPDSGVTQETVCVFRAEVGEKESAFHEESEAIAGVHLFSIQEIQKGLLEGKLHTQHKGQEVTAFLRDPFLTYALYVLTIE